jgi:cellulose synthase/poly-beta-1,6-N-acetylglucosamine synthase-like glycosyltransferase
MMQAALAVALDALLLVWIVEIVASTVAAWQYQRGLPRPEVPSQTPPVVVIFPVKGASATLPTFLTRLSAQDYPHYRIIAVVESTQDPAFELLMRHQALPGAPMTVHVAGSAENCGQKVWNLLHALEHVKPDDTLVGFIDADTLPSPLWLGRLVSAIYDAGHEAVSGYRWMMPMDNHLATATVSAANMSIVTLPKLPFAPNYAWGGTMLLRRELLERIDLKRWWQGAFSDDLQLTRALQAHAVPLASPRQCLLISPVAFTWRSAFSFAIRQYVIVATHAPALWWGAFLALLIPALGLVLAVPAALGGNRLAQLTLFLSAALGEWRGHYRRRIGQRLFAAEAMPGFPAGPLVERFLRPLWWGFHLLCLVLSFRRRHVEWAGYKYAIHGPQSVEKFPVASGPAG